jgi:hypothetical protein
MDETHAKVEELHMRKLRDKAEQNLIEMAQKDIIRFIEACRNDGLQRGARIGFIIGVVFVLIVYLIIN